MNEQASDRPLVKPASWPLALLVCKDCGKRSNGPAKLKPKKVAAELKHAARHLNPRPRVVLTTCLGPCPKRAMTIGAAGAATGTLVAIVGSMAEIDQAVPRLLPAPEQP